MRLLDYSEHALSSGGDAIAAAYVELAVGDQILWGVGVDANIVTASLKAVISARQPRLTLDPTRGPDLGPDLWADPSLVQPFSRRVVARVTGRRARRPPEPVWTSACDL